MPDTTLRRDLRKLTGSAGSYYESSLKDSPEKSPYTGAVGVGKPNSGTGGIASPLTEVTKTETITVSGAATQVTHADRTYYPQEIILSANALFVFAVKPVKQVKMTDANGAAVTIDWADPRHDVIA